jgi:putative two-component system response regulator
VLIVDDTAENLAVLAGLLEKEHRVRAANNGRRALEIAASEPRPDLILLDVMMPELDGWSVLERLQTDPATRGIPVIFLTALVNTADEERGLALGAVDYVTKPLRAGVLMARVRTQLELKRSRDLLASRARSLEEEVARRMAENLDIQEAAIHALGTLAEMRDNETGNHLRRTQAYVETLARALTDHPRFRHALEPGVIRSLALSAKLHDIGKVGIPDHILCKPGKLTAEEWVVMRTHPRLGGEAIAAAERDARRPIDFLRFAKEIATGHHEKWDGSGYPDGLKGDEIPISARLMAVADVYDALRTTRRYKPPFSPEDSRRILVDGRGTHFDPDVVDAFLACEDQFLAIAERWRDE